MSGYRLRAIVHLDYSFQVVFNTKAWTKKFYKYFEILVTKIFTNGFGFMSKKQDLDMYKDVS